MWLRWTDIQPVYHMHPKMRRGIPVTWDGKYCFVEYNDIEQEDLGDTTWHHFTFPGWFVCRTCWWHFWATAGGDLTPSNTPIYSLHHPDKSEAPSMRHIDLSDKEVGGIIDHAHRSVNVDKLALAIDATGIGFDADKVDGYHGAEVPGIPPHWHDTLPVLANVGNYTGFTGWQDAQIPATATGHREIAILLAHLRLTLVLADPVGDFWAWLGVRKKGLTPTYYPQLFFNQEMVTHEIAIYTQQFLVGLDPDGYFQWAVSTSVGADTCRVDANLFFNGSL